MTTDSTEFPWQVRDKTGAKVADRRTMSDALATANRLRLTNPEMGPYDCRGPGKDASIGES